MMENVAYQEALKSPALQWQSNKRKYNYPSKYHGLVPLKVMAVQDVKSDLSELSHILGIKENTIALKDNEYYVWVNSYGAVAAILPNGEKLGLKPDEFIVTAFHPKIK